MPIEYTMLKDAPVQFASCPACGQPWAPFLRGTVQRAKRRWWFFGPRQPYCAMICWSCKELIGYEDPDDPSEFVLVNKFGAR